jgi:hypothetical protein
MKEELDQGLTPGETQTEPGNLPVSGKQYEGIRRRGYCLGLAGVFLFWILCMLSGQPSSIFGASMAAPGGTDQHASVDQSLFGTWLVDPAHETTLGAGEMIGFKMGTSAPRIETSLVISTNSIIHRHKAIEGIDIADKWGRRLSAITGGDGAKYVTFEYKFTTNTNVTPRQIDLRWVGDDWIIIKGIYRVDGDTLWIAVPLLAGNERPGDFNDQRAPYELPTKCLTKATRVRTGLPETGNVGGQQSESK